jgi:Xaa-Pro aminopeptidase
MGLRALKERDQIVGRVRERLHADGLDAYLAYTPSNNFYCSGFRSWLVGEHWRFHGGNLTLVPADPGLPVAMMVPEMEAKSAQRESKIEDIRGFTMWMETRDLDVVTTPPVDGGVHFHRTSWWDAKEQDTIMQEILDERGLLKGRIGSDLEYITLRSAERFRSLAPLVEWVDWTGTMFELRALKLPFEIDCLRRATELQDAAFDELRANLKEGMTAVEVRHAYTRAVLDAANADDRYADFSESWALATLGSDSASDDAPSVRRLAKGDLVMLDGGATVGGYKGDGGRTFALGRPVDAARRLYDTLLAANDLACAALTPGRPISDAFLAAEQHMHANGYPQYCRGQYGHSIGLEQFPEEPPFICRDEHRLVEAGMVFAVETPYYGSDIGAINIEDLLLITNSGPEPLHRSPRGLVVVE